MAKDRTLDIECDHCFKKAKYMEEYFSGEEEKYVTKYTCRKHRERKNIRKAKQWL